MKRNFAYLLMLPLLLASCAENGNEGENSGGNVNIDSVSLPQTVKNYYKNVDTSKTGLELRNSIHQVVSKRTTTTYKQLWTIYKTTDIDSRGKINDIYSDISSFTPGRDQAGSYVGEGDVYNREHCVPKSWWGGSESNQGADPFIVLPSDGWVNSMRSNYSFGEVKSVTRKSAHEYSKLGPSKYREYNATVFEPNDEWKGDMARIYFYAATCYETSGWTGGNGSSCFGKNTTVGLTTYARKLFMKWHLQDPVSEWEIKRNNKVQNYTNNRNPFIDHPEWAPAIWGTETL